MKTTIEMPDRVWGRLATIAENRGLKVADVIAESITATVDHQATKIRRQYRPVDEAVIDEIRELHALGHSSPEIGRRIGVNPNTVRYHMRRLGLSTRTYTRRTAQGQQQDGY
ncbi:hypothetical protein GCM10027416_05950 [Okibacterium endophyticum]